MTRINCGVIDCINNAQGKCEATSIDMDWGQMNGTKGLGICMTSRPRPAPIIAKRPDDIKGD